MDSSFPLVHSDHSLPLVYSAKHLRTDLPIIVTMRIQSRGPNATSEANWYARKRLFGALWGNQKRLTLFLPRRSSAVSNFQRSLITAIAILSAAGRIGIGFGFAQGRGERTSSVVLTQKLPAMNGQTLSADVVEVTYGPSGASPVHTHPCPVIGYVTEGAIRMKVAGQQKEMTYQAGETFYEPPDTVHLVGANASGKVKAKFVAFFVCDHEAPLSSPVEGARQ